MAYVVDSSFESTPGAGTTQASGSGGASLDATHGILALFLIFLGLYMLASYGVFRKINNAL